MSQSNGFGQFLIDRLGVPRNPDGSVDRGRLFGRIIGSAVAGPIGGFLGGRIGGGDFNDFMGQLAGGARGVSTSFGRMFDNDPRTGFFNNPTAPWNTGRTTYGPDNPGVGHPDFVGPPAPDAGFVGPPVPGTQQSQRGDGMFSSGFGNGPSGQDQRGGTTTGPTNVSGGYNNLGHLNAALRFIQTNPSAWRGFGTAGRLGVGGNQNTGIGPFGMDSFQHTRGEIQGFTGNVK